MTGRFEGFIIISSKIKIFVNDSSIVNNQWDNQEKIVHLVLCITLYLYPFPLTLSQRVSLYVLFIPFVLTRIRSSIDFYIIILDTNRRYWTLIHRSTYYPLLWPVSPSQCQILPRLEIGYPSPIINFLQLIFII